MISKQQKESISRDYLLMPKDKNTLINAMKNLHYSTDFWELLIRDSEKMKFDLPQHQLSGFNFAYFIESVLKNSKFYSVVHLFEQFCIQSIRNNSSLINNRYYVGNGGSTAFQMISTYLVNRTINGSLQTEFKQIQQHVWNIFKYILDEQLIEDSQQGYLYYSLRLEPTFTNRTSETIELIMRQFVRHYKPNQNYQLRYNQFPWQINQFFPTLIQLYNGSFRSYQIGRHLNHSLQLLEQKLPILKNMAWQILRIINQKYEKFVGLYQSAIAKCLFKKLNLQLIKDLLTLDSFKNVIYSEEFVFLAFNSKNKNLCQLIWKNQNQRKKMAKFQREGKNILQNVAESYGLTFNIILMLWGSGLFCQMPHINNVKSRKIILSTYNIQQKLVL